MKLFLVVAALVLAKEAPTTLQIGVKHKVAPEDCIAAKKGDKLTMEYTGRLFENGKQFDSSVGRAPFEFTLGVGQVIKGWDQGIMGRLQRLMSGMCIGEKRKLTIPSELGYGSRGAGASIPPNAALVFDIELFKINGKGATAPSDEL
ncbi:FK506-binding protein 2A [Kappamyces sp. JEL0829]|nr:FK506-binding protein 2A [Kappamyces sp. JEL0829]